MPSKTKNEAGPFDRNDRVELVRPLRGVPSRAQGKVKVTNGLGPWLRYWVKFDSGVWVGQISQADLIGAGTWDAYTKRRDEEERKATEAAAAAAAHGGGDDAGEAAGGDAGAGAASGPASKVPAHLLERSRQARERRAAAASGG